MQCDKPALRARRCARSRLKPQDSCFRGGGARTTSRGFAVRSLHRSGRINCPWSFRRLQCQDCLSKSMIHLIDSAVTVLRDKSSATGWAIVSRNSFGILLQSIRSKQIAGNPQCAAISKEHAKMACHVSQKAWLSAIRLFPNSCQQAQYPHRIYPELSLSTILTSWHMTPVSQTRL